VTAPDGVIVNEAPLHIEPLFIETTGFAFTVTELIALALQPAALVPVTVYVVFDVGATTELPLE
jgi:hypothetical protein